MSTTRMSHEDTYPEEVEMNAQELLATSIARSREQTMHTMKQQKEDEETIYTVVIRKIIACIGERIITYPNDASMWYSVILLDKKRIIKEIYKLIWLHEFSKVNKPTMLPKIKKEIKYLQDRLLYINADSLERRLDALGYTLIKVEIVRKIFCITYHVRTQYRVCIKQ
jgi:hypothetical protein